MAQQGRQEPGTNPDEFSYGDNSLSSRAIFEQRLIYNELIFSDEKYPRLFETWGRDKYYGTLNTKGNTVQVVKSELRPLSFPTGDSEFCLNFVADAWRDFALRLRELSDQNIIFRDSPWSAPTISKAWSSINEEYYQYMATGVFSAFNGTYLDVAGRDRHIGDIQSFIAMFEKFIDDVLVDIGPLTVSGLLESNYLSPLVSGLMIELDGGAYDEDFYKCRIYKDRNFQLVVGLAEQYGFAIDKNIPWRLVADLRNPAMREYMYGVPIVGFDADAPPPEDCDPVYTNPDAIPRAFGYSQIPGLEDVVRRNNVYVDEGELKPGYPQYQQLKEVSDQEKIYETLYEQAYEETWHTDMRHLSDYILNFYNTYAETNSLTAVRDPFLVGQECTPPVRMIERLPIELEAFEELYSDRWRLKTFYVARSMERATRLSRNNSTRNIQEIMNVYNLSRTDGYKRALRYAQEKFIGPKITSQLTLDTVGDIMGSKETQGSQEDDLSNSGRQSRLRRNLY